MVDIFTKAQRLKMLIIRTENDHNLERNVVKQRKMRKSKERQIMRIKEAH